MSVMDIALQLGQTWAKAFRIDFPLGTSVRSSAQKLNSMRMPKDVTCGESSVAKVDPKHPEVCLHPVRMHVTCGESSFAKVYHTIERRPTAYTQSEHPRKKRTCNERPRILPDKKAQVPRYTIRSNESGVRGNASNLGNRDAVMPSFPNRRATDTLSSPKSSCGAAWRRPGWRCACGAAPPIHGSPKTRPLCQRGA